MIEVNLKEKLNQEKQKSIKKQQDKDLELYLVFQRELLEYRVCLIPLYSVPEINSLSRKHRAILEKLAKRLKIPLISNLRGLKK